MASQLGRPASQFCVGLQTDGFEDKREAALDMVGAVVSVRARHIGAKAFLAIIGLTDVIGGVIGVCQFVVFAFAHTADANRDTSDDTEPLDFVIPRQVLLE